MFALQKHWSTPHEAFAKWRWKFPSYEELREQIEKQVHDCMQRGNNDDNLEVESIQFVLEPEGYTQLKQTAQELYGLSTTKRGEEEEEEEEAGNRKDNNDNKDKEDEKEVDNDPDSNKKVARKKNDSNDSKASLYYSRDGLIQPLLVYHCTQNVDKVNSILRHGYLIPGRCGGPFSDATQGWTLRMQNGNPYYGEGIYASPHLDLARWYSLVDLHKSVQLIVNILLAGETLVVVHNRPLGGGGGGGAAAAAAHGLEAPAQQQQEQHVSLNVDTGMYTLTTLRPVKKTNDNHNKTNKDDKKPKDPSTITIRSHKDGNEKEGKEDYTIVTEEDCFHTLRSPDMTQWVCGSSRRMIPVALVTLCPNTQMTPQHEQMQQQSRELSRQSCLQPGNVVFTHFGYDLHVMSTSRAALQRRTSLTYHNAYTLLIATLLLAQHREQEQEVPWDDSVHLVNAVTFQLFRGGGGAAAADAATRMDHPRALLERARRVSDYSLLLPPVLSSTPYFQENYRYDWSQRIIAASETLVENCHDEQVPSDQRRMEHLFGKTVTNLFWDYVATDNELQKDYPLQPRPNASSSGDGNRIPRHYMVVPASLFGGHYAFAQSVASFLNSLDNAAGTGGSVAVEKFIAVGQSDATEHEKTKKDKNHNNNKTRGNLCRIVNHDTVMQLHSKTKPAMPGKNKTSKVDENSDNAEDGVDSLIEPLSQVVDHLTEEEDNDKYVNFLYLVVYKPPEDLPVSTFVQQWQNYCQVKHIIVHLIFMDGIVHNEVCRLKAHLHTVPDATSSFEFYHVCTTLSQVSDIWTHIRQDVDCQLLSLLSSSPRLVSVAVPFPFGVVGEGFLRTVGLEPSWKVAVFGQAVLFQGCPPPYICHNGNVYQTTTIPKPGAPRQVEQYAQCVLTLMASFQNFLFRSPERVGIYQRVVQQWAQNLDARMDPECLAPSVSKEIRYKLASFLRSMQVYGNVSFRGKWFDNLTQMKYGQKVARRANPLGVSLHDLPPWLQNSPRVKEPSDALALVPLAGRMIRCHLFAGCQVEPWLIVVEYVSLDTINTGSKTTVDMFLAGERGEKVKDSRNRVVTDILLMDLGDNDDNGGGGMIAKLYHGYVFTKTPYLYMPSQHAALVVNSMMTCIETAFRLCVEYRQGLRREQQTTNGGGGDEDDDGVKERDHSPPPPPCLASAIPQHVKDEVTQYMEIAIGMLDRVRDLMNHVEAHGWIDSVTQDENVEKYLTEAYGVQSMNQFLAALMLPRAAHLVATTNLDNDDNDNDNDNDNADNADNADATASSKWPRLCLGILAEAVMRNCRARVKAGKYSATQLMDRVLGITRGSTVENYQRHIRRCSQRTNSSMTHSFTNCSPFQAVGVLYVIQHLHASATTTTTTTTTTMASLPQRLSHAFLSGEASMGRFLKDFLPGYGGYITQLALYLQGMDSQKAKYRQDLRFHNPKQVVDRIIQQRLEHYQVERLQQDRTHHRRHQRKLIRWAQAQPFGRHHGGLPRLFTPAEVERLNQCRPANDQLVLITTTGLLKHHCCYPQCPDYLRNFQTAGDEKRGTTRRGLFRHLRHDLVLGMYQKNWHVVSRRYALQQQNMTVETFVAHLKREFPAYAPCEELAPLQYNAYRDWRERQGQEKH